MEMNLLKLSTFLPIRSSGLPLDTGQGCLHFREPRAHKLYSSLSTLYLYIICIHMKLAFIKHLQQKYIKNYASEKRSFSN